jgi:hypothetical protein
MYLRSTQRRNKDGSVVRYLALAENSRDPVKGYVQAKVIHNFGRADRLDRAALERLVGSIRRVLGEEASERPDRALEIEAVYDLGVVLWCARSGTNWGSARRSPSGSPRKS